MSMPVRRRPDHLPKYVLILFTRHGDGLWHFADALGKAGRDWEGAWRTEVTNLNLAKAEKKHADEPGLFDPQELFATELFDPDEYERRHRVEWQTVIESNIRNLLAAHGPFRLPDHIVAVYGTILGAANDRHVRAAVKALHAAGEVVNTGVEKYFFREMIRPVN
ncbi:MAG: hypothetical protein ACT4NY_04830 [Pseudonocardiales bacterium]